MERAGIGGVLLETDRRNLAQRRPKSPLKEFLSLLHNPVMAVTERYERIGDTPIVNMVQRASINALLEPGDTE
jgi:hypothetical protein